MLLSCDLFFYKKPVYYSLFASIDSICEETLFQNLIDAVGVTKNREEAYSVHSFFDSILPELSLTLAFSSFYTLP